MTNTATLIAEITEQLEPIAALLQEALDRANEFMSRDYAYQWVIDFADVDLSSGVEILQNFQTLTLPVRDFGAMFGWAPSHQPQVGQLLPGWSPRKITGSRREDFPPALAARNELIREIPAIGSNTDGQTKNVYDIINLPEALAQFYEAWTTVLNEVTPLNAAMESVLNIDGTFTWSGNGYAAYSAMAKSNAGAAEATEIAVKVITDGVFALVDMVLNLVHLLKEIAMKNIDDVTGLVDTLVTIFDATRWIDVVTELIGFVGDNLKDSLEAAVRGADEIRSNAEALAPFQTLEGQMNEKIGQSNSPSSKPYPSWPQNRGGLTEEWSGDASAKIEIQYLSEARKVWTDIRDSLLKAYSAANGGGDIPMVADQSGNFTALITLLNELKEHVRVGLLWQGYLRAAEMVTTLTQVAHLYVLNEVTNQDEIRELEALLDQ